jgi:pyridoxal phosphate enzyme (YggS family)
MGIAENIAKIKSEINENVKLVAVSKTKPVEDIMDAYDAGHKIFGENKAQELAGKFEVLPRDIEWHFIGHLQTNKVKYIAPFVSLIHGIDSLKLLKTINKEAKKKNRVIDCLLQFHIAEEETKFGLDENEADEILTSSGYKELENVRITGVMGMATYTTDTEQIRSEFRHLKNIFETLKEKYFGTDESFKEVSMGMSGDYKIAVEEGSTIVRIGSAIFGARN